MTPKEPRPNGDVSPAQDDERHDKPQTLLQWILSLIDTPRCPKWFKRPVLILLFFAGVMMVFWAMLPEKTQQEMIEGVMSGRILAAGYYPSVSVDSETSVLDLSEWSPSRSGIDVKQCCKATWKQNLQVRRVHNESRYFAKRIATSGEKPEVRSSTHELWVSRVRGQRASGPSMKRYDVLLDISKEKLNVPFALELVTTRYGGFADSQGEWAALAILQPTARVVLTIKFPKNKPPRNLRYSSSTRAERSKYQPLEDGTFEVEQTDELLLILKIDHPPLGYAYRVDWEW